MNSDRPYEDAKPLSLWDEFVEQSQNIQRDDSARASIEKPALDENHALMEEIVDEVIVEMAWTRVKANRGAPGPDGITIEEFPEWFQSQWEPSTEGTMQGGPLSPLLSNIYLDDLDKELEKRGLPFVRYADDFVIFTKTEVAAHRVYASVS